MASETPSETPGGEHAVADKEEHDLSMAIENNLNATDAAILQENVFRTIADQAQAGLDQAKAGVDQAKAGIEGGIESQAELFRTIESEAKAGIDAAFGSQAEALRMIESQANLAINGTLEFQAETFRMIEAQAKAGVDFSKAGINATLESVTGLGEQVGATLETAQAKQKEAFATLATETQARQAEALERIAEVAGGFSNSSKALGGAGTTLFGWLPSLRLPGLPGLSGSLFARRTVEIWTFVGEMAIKMSNERRSGGSQERRQQISEDLCEGLIRLGPTFIKLGQILSTRFDILPYDYVKGLEKMQDSVPPFDGKQAYEIVVEELGPDAFSEFDETPIAAASLGQVHLAKTKDGQQVAVKVQRRGLKELFNADLANLRILADLLYRADDTPDSLLRDWREIFESNAAIIYEEIDYLKEASNGKRFAKNFEKFAWVKVPDVYDELSTGKVLTMEYVPGIKISDVKQLKKAGYDPRDLARQSGESFMIQLLRFGYFHCDPHPGNIAVDGKGPNGRPRLVYYDFGMVETLSERLRKALVDGFFALYERDKVESPKKIAQALIDGELLGGKVDRLSVEKITRYFLGNFRERLALDRNLPISNEEKTQLRMKAMQDIGNELAAVASDKPFRYPPGMPYVLRAFNALEGVGKALDTDYDITRIAKKYLRNLIDLRDGNAAVTVVKKVQEVVGLRPKDFMSIILQARRVTESRDALIDLASGELQPRVRALEIERAMVRSSLMQRASLWAIAAIGSLNVCTILAVTATAGAGLLRVLFTRIVMFAMAISGFRCVMAIKRFLQLEKAEREGNLNEYVLESKRAAAR